jgi:prolyl oligopeptidase
MTEYNASSHQWPLVRGLVVGCLLLAPLSASASESALSTIIDEHWQWVLEQYPERRLEYGDRSGNNQWTDMSPEAFQRRYDDEGQFVQRLEQLEPATLTSDEQINRAMLLRQLRDNRTEFEDGLHLIALNMRSGPQHRHSMIDYLPMDSEQDYQDWLARLSALPEQLGDYRALLQEGIARERTQAQIVMSRVPAQIQNLITDDAAESPFYRAFAEMPESFDEETRETLSSSAATIIAEEINPALQELLSFLEQDYLPAARAPGIGSLPGGKQVYSRLAQHFTTTDLTPDEIHEIGLQEVARIRSEMLAVIEEVKFEGDIAAFNTFLRTDPQFYYDTPEALLEGYQAVSKRLDPGLVKLFGKLPRAPYGVRPIPDEEAPDTTTAYYMRPAIDGSRPGWYYVNLHQPAVRPKFEMEVLSVHESVPGHHLQIALAQELTGLPEFRRNGGFTAFIEGWGLYSERLGYDMGLYTDPYSRYGQLVYDMWRAVRLVVDTGIHYFGWSRQKAIDYFLDNAAKSEADIINEIDRYIGWPGQALAYKIGQLKMLALRSKAEAALGDRFDIRSFHDHMLGAGALPLDILEARMDAWLAAQLANQDVAENF